MNIIETNIPRLRDPFVLVEDGIYYMYGSDWVCYKNESGDLQDGWGLLDKEIVVKPDGFVKHPWAPEVHKYNGKFYMFTTYYSAKTNHRGCTILKADSPEGPFVEITDGHITPSDWDAIDGTLYVDNEGRPWMVFVHEWTSTDDNIGRMAVAKLSDDLTRFVSAPMELFRADDPDWATKQITDGCWMYTTKQGELLMLWSNFAGDEDIDYRIGIARSENGLVDGRWLHQKQPLYSKDLSGVYDGGHGMIFAGSDGTQYLCLHAPNEPVGDRLEKPILIPIREENGTLVLQ